MCDSWYDEGPSAWSESWRRARKSHKCCACHEAIPAGHRYHYASGIWDGRPGSFKHCARCWHLLCLLEERTEGVALRLDCGELWRDNFRDPEPAELAFLTKDEAQELVAQYSPGRVP